VRFWPPKISDVALNYIGYPPGNHLFSPPSLTNVALGYDVFPHELGHFSQRLVKLELRGATLDLRDCFDSSTSNSWPHLESRLLLDQQPASSNGTWYFTLDPHMSMEEYEEEYTDPDARTLDDMRLYMFEDELAAAMDVPTEPLRTATDSATFKEIYVATASAVKRMSKLRVLEIWFELHGESGFGRGKHEFRYVHGTDSAVRRLQT
jgi:hypothetical protein